jgi:competence protein ComEA
MSPARGMLTGMNRIGIARARAAVGLALCIALGAQAAELNLANQAELEMVKGVGPQLSERILAEREHGRFEGWSDFIARMKGIGPASAARLSAAGLRIGGLPYVPPADGASAPVK